eukprot:2176523-Pleurochrysis_carterae.AAC.1
MRMRARACAFAFACARKPCLGLLLLVGVALLVARRERDEQPFSRVKQQLVEEEAEADPAERGGHRAEKDDQTRLRRRTRE